MNAVTTPISGIRLNQLSKQMGTAQTYAEWQRLAQDYDQISGANRWRKADETTMYDWQEVQVRRDKLRQCLDEGAYRELLYALNEGVHGNMGGMGRPILYSRAMCGTKLLIDDYVAAIAESLEAIHTCPESVISYPEKMDFFRRASHCYGRSALLLSGGAGLIYFHHGVVQELINHDLLPNVISGASAGSVVAAQVGTLPDETLKAGYFTDKRYIEPTQTRLMDVFLGRVSDDDARVAREKTLDEVVPRDMTFQDAFELTGRYINISISPAEKHQSSRLMNAITSPNVFIRSAVSASSSVPGVMPAERLYARGFDGKPRPYLATRRWVDGSVSGDLPAKRLSRLYGVNHFIVSLINPLVVPFVNDIKSRDRRGFKSTLSVSAIRLIEESLAVAENVLSRSGKAGNRVAAQVAYLMRMLEQDYLGDINILLAKQDFKWRHTVFEFKPDEVEAMVAIGMRRTWTKIAMIKNAALISKTLDRILESLDQQSIAPDAEGKHLIYN